MKLSYITPVPGWRTVGCLGCHAFEKDEEYGLGIVTKQADINWTPEDFKKVLSKQKDN